MPNPFFYGGCVKPEQFVGRRAELRRILAGLDIAHTGQMQSFSIVGPRRIGKSSLLFYVANRYAHYLTILPVIARSEAINQSPNRELGIASQTPLAMTETPYRLAYIELQDARCHTLTGLLDTILKELGVDARVGNTSPLVAFQDAIHALKARGVLPIVCLDEFEELAYRREQFTLDFYESLRFLMNQHALALVTASKTPLIDLAQTLGYTSQFFNIFTHLSLGEFTDDEARELIARGAICDRPFTPTEQMEILTLAGKHPYKLQLAGSLLYHAKAENRTVDWAKLQREFVTQLQHVGLEADLSRTLRRVGEKSKGTVIDAAKAVIRELFKWYHLQSGAEETRAEKWATILLYLIFGVVLVGAILNYLALSVLQNLIAQLIALIGRARIIDLLELAELFPVGDLYRVAGGVAGGVALTLSFLAFYFRLPFYLIELPWQLVVGFFAESAPRQSGKNLSFFAHLLR